MHNIQKLIYQFKKWKCMGGINCRINRNKCGGILKQK